MKTFIESDELYPFYYLTDCDIMTHEVEFTDEEFEFVTKTLSDFWKVQELLKLKSGRIL